MKAEYALQMIYRQQKIWLEQTKRAINIAKSDFKSIGEDGDIDTRSRYANRIQNLESKSLYFMQTIEFIEKYAPNEAQ